MTLSPHSLQSACTSALIEELEPLALHGTADQFIQALDRHNLQALSDIPGAPRLIDVAIGVVVESSMAEDNPLSENQTQMIEACLAKGANINSYVPDGPQLLAHTIISGNSELARLLINKGANLRTSPHRPGEEEGGWNRNALMWALQCSRMEIIDGLIEKSNLNDIDEDGWTALFFAVSRGLSDATKKLIEMGSDVNQKDYTEDCVMHTLPWEDHPENSSLMLHFLLDAGANPHAQDQDGNTPRDRCGNDGGLRFDQCLSEWNASRIDEATPLVVNPQSLPFRRM